MPNTITLPKTILMLIALAASLPSQLLAQSAVESSNPAIEAYEEVSSQLERFNSQHSRVFEGARVPIHYLQWTDDGIPLILLHGTYSTAHDFARFAPRLVEAGYRPFSIDWYGHGKTPIPDTTVSARDFADDLNQLLGSLNIDKAVVAGHSRGGALATIFYEAYPNRALGLVLIDGGSTCIARDFAKLGKDGLAKWLKPNFDPETGRPLAPSYATREDLFLATWERFGKPEDPSEMFDVLSQIGKDDEGRWTRWRPTLRQWLGQDTYENTINGMLTPKDAPTFFASTVLLEPAKALEMLDIPLLIIDATGRDADDRDFTSTEQNEQLKKLHPDLIEHVKIPVGHFVHRAAPDAFLSAMVAFQERLPKSTETP